MSNYCYNNPVKLVDPDGREPQGWIKQIINGTTSYTYDKNINTVAQAKAANYQNVKSVSSALTISRESTLGFGGYEYKLRSTGTVDYMNHDFVTDAGTAINNVQRQPGLPSPKIEFIGGLGDPFGVYEAGMRGLSSYNPEFAMAVSIYSIAKGKPQSSSAGFASGGSVKVSSIWSSTSKLSSVKNAFGHWKKHAAEFPEFVNSKQYVEGTKNFLNNSPAGTMIKTRSNGDVLKYHPETNTFGVMDATGVPKTMFRPNNGIEYWKKQK
jgi:hypothetical protein